jgi:purine-binding chemotaxis protein CheW
MENKPYLIFSLHGLHYGVDALQVLEIFHLPELSPVTEAPDDIVGLLNLRGKIVPVMHLDLRLRHQLQECSLSDSVIVLEWEGLQIGIIVTSVHEVKNITSEAIEEQISYGRVRESNSQFIAGVARVDDGIIMLLDHEKLLRHSDAVEAVFPDLASNGHHKGGTLRSFYSVCCPNATSEEKAIFRERADNLKRSTESSDFTGLMPLAVVGLNGEYFGLDLKVVREFTNIRNVTPIPCCPDHIVGNMNVRGEIVTLVDIRRAINMPLASGTASKAIVVHVDDIVAGFPVDEVFDVMYLRSSEIKSVPAAVHSGSDEYLQGTAPYSEKMLSILDLPKILLKGGLTVNDEV